MRIVNENGVNLERPKGNEEPKSKYYIIPEGDNTEIQYFCGIRDNSEELNIKQIIEIIPVENEDEEHGQSHPKRKLDNFNKSIADEKFIYNENFDKAFFVIDRDPQNFSEEQLNEFIENCNKDGYFVCLSNPTFELFLLMHDDKIFDLDRRKMLENKRSNRGGKRFLEIKLSEIFGCNKRNIDFKKFLPNIKKAIKNEKKFCEGLEKLKNELGSNVGKLLNEMIENKIVKDKKVDKEL